MKTLLITLLACFLIGCASPYQGQIDAVSAAYQAGQISEREFMTQMTELKTLEQQHNQEQLRGWQAVAENYANQTAADRQAQDANHQQSLDNYYRQQEINNQKYQYQQQQRQSQQPQTYEITDQYGNKKKVTVKPAPYGSY